MELESKEVSDKFELAFPDKQKDIQIHVSNKYNGKLSGITLEAAEAYVEQGGNLLKAKTKSSRASDSDADKNTDKNSQNAGGARTSAAQKDKDK